MRVMRTATVNGISGVGDARDIIMVMRARAILKAGLVFLSPLVCA